MNPKGEQGNTLGMRNTGARGADTPTKDKGRLRQQKNQRLRRGSGDSWGG